MELEHSFTIPVPPEQAWGVLLDVEKVAPCMPGATIDSVDGDVIKGRIKVKVGPVALTYAGTARFTEKDEQAHAVVWRHPARRPGAAAPPRPPSPPRWPTKPARPGSWCTPR